MADSSSQYLISSQNTSWTWTFHFHVTARDLIGPCFWGRNSGGNTLVGVSIWLSALILFCPCCTCTPKVLDYKILRKYETGFLNMRQWENNILWQNCEGDESGTVWMSSLIILGIVAIRSCHPTKCVVSDNLLFC